MDGIYEIVMNTPMGNMNGKVTLKSNGDNLNGVLEIMGMKNNLTGGKVKGNQCYFKGNMKNNAINIEYEIMGQLSNNILNIFAKTNMGEFKLQGKKIG
ncbi:MAG: hypothetical protein GX682_05605 [Clostridiaceae bacterium]|nr:hypothetical protein [Clostridiaceae bacterium]